MNFMPSPPIWPTLFWTRPTLNFNKFLLVFFSLFNCPLKNQLVTKTWIIVWYLISWFGDEFCYPAVYWASLGAILSICLDSCLWVASHMGEETISCCAHLSGRPIPSNVQQRKKPSSWNKLSSSFSCLGGGLGFSFLSLWSSLKVTIQGYKIVTIRASSLHTRKHPFSFNLAQDSANPAALGYWWSILQ